MVGDVEFNTDTAEAKILLVDNDAEQASLIVDK